MAVLLVPLPLLELAVLDGVALEVVEALPPDNEPLTRP